MLLQVAEGQALTSGTRIIVGSIPLSALVDLAYSPWRDARTKEGYQRKPTMGRIARLMNEIRQKKVDIPTAILLNAEHSSWENAVISDDSCGHLLFDTEKYEGKFSVVDGQHRVVALKYLFDEDEDLYQDFKLQFVMMLGASYQEELEQFYVVNSTAKSVKTDLALDLLKQRAEHDGQIMKGLVEAGQDWKIRAQGLTERMADYSEIWRRRIRLANEDKGVTIIPSASFVTSLKAFLVHPYVQRLNEDQQFRLLETYWTGIRIAMPQPFSTPNDYTLLKGIGVWALHELLPVVIEVIRSRGESLFEPQNYADLLDSMFEDLDGENQEAELVKGHEFWKTAPKGGAAGSFSSSAGKRVLLSKMKQGLPRPDIE